MTTWSTVIPAVVVVALAVAFGIVNLPQSPRASIATRTAIVVIGAITFFGVIVLGLVCLSARAYEAARMVSSPVSERVNHAVSGTAGTLAVGVLVFVGVRTWRVLRRYRRAISGTQGRRLLVLDTDRPVAYAAPGRPGCIVVSRGMLDVLSPPERRVLFMHERAHLDMHHSRYLLIGELTVALLPLLRPIVDQLRLATERSADEFAAAAVGDRRLVARSIARAALSAHDYRGTTNGLAGAFGGGVVPVRVEALLNPAPRRGPLSGGNLAAGVVVAALLVGGVFQFHHVFDAMFMM